MQYYLEDRPPQTLQFYLLEGPRLPWDQWKGKAMMINPLHVGTDLDSWAPSHAGLSPCPSWTRSCWKWWGGGPPRPPSASHSRPEELVQL